MALAVALETPALCDVENTFFTNSTAEFDTIANTSVTASNTVYSIELQAEMQGSGLLYDQVFTVPFSDPSVQAAVAQAESILNGAGATSISGPSLISDSSALSGATSTIVTGSTLNDVISATEEFVGPLDKLVGDFGVCQSYTLDANNYATVSNCSAIPGTLSLTAGQDDFDTFVLALFTVDQTTTETTTDTITQVYRLDGVAPATALPEPPAGLLFVAGLAGLVLHRRKLARR